MDYISPKEEAIAPLLEITWHDIELGELLGEGSFNQVNAVSIVHASRQRLASLSMKGKDSYALKHFSDERKRCSTTMQISLIDLQSEANLLGELSHKNIITLHAVNADMHQGHDAFLLLDRLFGTVEEKLQEWNEQMKRSVVTLIANSISLIANSISQREDQAAQEERLGLVAVPVACAMEYMHSKSIVFRDLKPSNIGFNFNGTVKIFDLGLAKKVVNDGRRLTGCTGTMQYMAPEVAEARHYGLSADTYSFGILLWELCTLKKPFDNLTPDQIMDSLANDKRPRLTRKSGSPKVQSLISICWDSRAENRPSFTTINTMLANFPTSHGSQTLAKQHTKGHSSRGRNHPKDEQRSEESC